MNRHRPQNLPHRRHLCRRYHRRIQGHRDGLNHYRVPRSIQCRRCHLAPRCRRYHRCHLLHYRRRLRLCQERLQHQHRPHRPRWMRYWSASNTRCKQRHPCPRCSRRQNLHNLFGHILRLRGCSLRYPLRQRHPMCHYRRPDRWDCSHLCQRYRDHRYHPVSHLLREIGLDRQPSNHPVGLSLIRPPCFRR
jgi:hypothetical protein